MNKKGNMLLAGLVIMAMVFTLVVTVFILKVNVIDPFNTDVQGSTDYGTDAKQISADTSANYPSQWDAIIIIIFVTSWIASMLLGRDLDSHAVYFAIALIVMVVVIMVGMILVNTYEDIRDDPEYSGIESDFPLTNWLITNIVPIIIIVMVSIGVVMYAKI